MNDDVGCFAFDWRGDRTIGAFHREPDANNDSFLVHVLVIDDESNGDVNKMYKIPYLMLKKSRTPLKVPTSIQKTAVYVVHETFFISREIRFHFGMLGVYAISKQIAGNKRSPAAGAV